MKITNKTGNDFSIFESVVTDAYSILNYRANLAEIIISTEKNYGDIIAEIDENESYTNTADYTGFGKTIFDRSTKLNTVIIREEIIHSLIKKPISSLDEIKFKNQNIQFSHYLVLHELGHCIDNVDRNIHLLSVYPNSFFKVRKILNFYFLNATCEYNAEKLPKHYLSDEYIQLEITNLETSYEIMMKDFNQYKILYKNDLRNLAFSILNSFALFFIQYSRYLSLTNGTAFSNEYLDFSQKYFAVSPKNRNFDREFSNSYLSEILFRDILINLERYGFRIVELEGETDALYY